MIALKSRLHYGEESKRLRLCGQSSLTGIELLFEVSFAAIAGAGDSSVRSQVVCLRHRFRIIKILNRGQRPRDFRMVLSSFLAVMAGS